MRYEVSVIGKRIIKAKSKREAKLIAEGHMEESGFSEIQVNSFNIPEWKVIYQTVSEAGFVVTTLICDDGRVKITESD